MNKFKAKRGVYTLLFQGEEIAIIEILNDTSNFRTLKAYHLTWKNCEDLIEDTEGLLKECKLISCKLGNILYG